MHKKILTIILLLIIFINAYPQQIIQPTNQEKLIIERFEYIRQIKKYISDYYWKDFAKNEFPGTIVYFSDSASYFINPLPEMKNKVSKYSILENDYDWNIWKLRMPLDSAKFVMETQFQFDPKTKGYINYKTPVLFCSSPELTQKEKVVINTTQEWAIAMVHELYHQYQYANDAILTYVLRLYQEKKMIDMDSMQGIYNRDKDFHDTLQLENDLLKRAIISTSFDEERQLFSQFLKLRTKRNSAYFKKNKFWMSTAESFWEKLEGTCLMIEKQLKENFQKIKPTAYIEKYDDMYDKLFVYNEKDITEINFYSTLNDERFYVGTTGYNMVQLLEKNKVPYKDNLYNYASLPLDLQLKYFYKIK